MATEEIKITIAAKSYTLNIDSAKREHYRLAEKRVNASITKFQQMNFEGFKLQDAIALSAFEFAVANLALKQQSEVDPEELTALKAINNKLEEYLFELF
ncbi:MAG: cell division protein ZapA [Rikenellaceae bacterium]